MRSRIVTTTFASMRRRVMAAVHAVGTESIPIETARGRVLAESIRSSEPHPAQNRSAMDGFALRSSDTHIARDHAPVALPFAGTIAAGQSQSFPLPRGEAVKIMTGAPLPQGADCVVRIEDVTVRDNRVLISRSVRKWNDTRRKGTDLKRKQLVLRPGVIIGPSEMAMLAMLDHRRVSVHRRPRVGVLSTGDELGPVGRKRPYGHIPDSNRYGLLGLVESAGCAPINGGCAGDDPQELLQRLRALARRSDFLVTTGGVSAGDFDVIKILFRTIGGVNLYRVAMRPGKPQAFGHLGKTPFFGLPGNPVSSMVVFDFLIRPALRKMAGARMTDPMQWPAVAREDFPRKHRESEFPRVVAENKDGNWLVWPAKSQRSSDLMSMTDAHGYVPLSPHDTAPRKGDIVTFVPFAV